ncbi:MAG: N-acetyltransferase [Salinivirgaceae bacterium]|nr:N-acetyltransferase [Salinivirgaceae bacterium]
MNIYDCLRLPLKDVPTDCIRRFDCGREDINNFFYYDVEKNQQQMFGKTYFFCDGTPQHIVGAITVANASIFTRHISWRRRDVIGAEVDTEKSGQNFPAVLLGRLGVDVHYQHLHLGPQIIEYVKAWFSSENNKSGCRFLIVDAYNEPGLIQFYERCGLTLFFSSEEQEKKYRNIIDREGEQPVKLETRLMFFDLINCNNDNF